MRLKELQSRLEGLSGFDAPRVDLEQYVTSPHLAAQMLFAAESQFGDIEDRSVCDLGCGSGILTIASIYQGASYVMGLDVDPKALAIAVENLTELELEEEVDLVCCKITDPSVGGQPRLDRLRGAFDTVVMNPPYGTKTAGADMVFLQFAAQMAKTAIYSLHKTSTRDFIQKKALTLGFQGEVVAKLRYDLPKTMRFHKDRSRDIEVDFWRFARIPST